MQESDERECEERFAGCRYKDNKRSTERGLKM
jgi:hypothetical protein